MLDKKKHEQILKNILRDIYTTTDLEGKLAFKGGTCLYLFYGLDRFSVDMDFNLLAEDFNDQLVTDILKKYLTIDDRFNKYFTWFWLGSYEKSNPKIKVEINKRVHPDKYINKDFYGLTIPIMAPDLMFAHKLCAITDRKKLQNRDLFDAHFMFTKQFDINEEIIKIRTDKTLKEYFIYLIDFIEKNVNPNTILDGLGELINDQQKDRVKATLKRDLLFDLKSRVQS
ncbi:MAG: nucleotidyl transferase AbiEii/AbiGii toxin family protein [Candidatus Levybacteria bacterium]|nr:nucleotidyl transferase AbiEii/AbiGii toxin family protein [Candidatus Levybacteria bacterium]